MKVEKKVSFCVLNVKMPEHSTKLYKEKFEKAFSYRVPFKLRGETYGMVGSVFHLDKDKQNEILYGVLYKFTNIEIKGAWFNIKKEKEASPDEIKLIKIPPNLKPNYASFNYIFFPKSHRLAVEIHNSPKSISPSLVKSLFQQFLNQEKLNELFPESDVIIEQSEKKLEELLSKEKLNSIYIHISMPNPDDLGSAEGIVFGNMDEQNARSWDTKLTSKPKVTLLPNDDTRRLANVAASNGYVEVTAKDVQGNTIIESSVAYPVIETLKYDPNKLSFFEVFRHRASEIIQSIIGRQ